MALENCFSFDFPLKQCLYCDQNQEKRYISGTEGYCTDECSIDEVAYTFFLDDGKPYPQSFMKCVRSNKIQVSLNLENCKRLDYDISIDTGETLGENILKGCVECLDNYKGYIEDETSYRYSHFVDKPA